MERSSDSSCSWHPWVTQLEQENPGHQAPLQLGHKLLQRARQWTPRARLYPTVPSTGTRHPLPPRPRAVGWCWQQLWGCCCHYVWRPECQKSRSVPCSEVPLAQLNQLHLGMERPGKTSCNVNRMFTYNKKFLKITTSCILPAEQGKKGSSSLFL